MDHAAERRPRRLPRAELDRALDRVHEPVRRRPDPGRAADGPVLERSPLPGPGRRSGSARLPVALRRLHRRRPGPRRVHARPQGPPPDGQRSGARGLPRSHRRGLGDGLRLLAGQTGEADALLLRPAGPAPRRKAEGVGAGELSRRPERPAAPDPQRRRRGRRVEGGAALRLGSDREAPRAGLHESRPAQGRRDRRCVQPRRVPAVLPRGHRSAGDADGDSPRRPGDVCPERLAPRLSPEAGPRGLDGERSDADPLPGGRRAPATRPVHARQGADLSRSPTRSAPAPGYGSRSRRSVGTGRSGTSRRSTAEGPAIRSCSGASGRRESSCRSSAERTRREPPSPGRPPCGVSPAGSTRPLRMGAEEASPPVSASSYGAAILNLPAQSIPVVRSNL